MKANQFSQRCDLFDDIFKQVQGHHFFFTDDLGAKTTLQIADIADFNVDFMKAFFIGHHIGFIRR